MENGGDTVLGTMRAAPILFSEIRISPSRSGREKKREIARTGVNDGRNTRVRVREREREGGGWVARWKRWMDRGLTAFIPASNRFLRGGCAAVPSLL